MGLFYCAYHSDADINIIYESLFVNEKMKNEGLQVEIGHSFKFGYTDDEKVPIERFDLGWRAKDGVRSPPLAGCTGWKGIFQIKSQSAKSIEEVFFARIAAGFRLNPLVCNYIWENVENSTHTERGEGNFTQNRNGLGEIVVLDEIVLKIMEDRCELFNIDHKESFHEMFDRIRKLINYKGFSLNNQEVAEKVEKFLVDNPMI